MKTTIFMNQFFNTCRKCLSTKTLIILAVFVVALLIFVPIIGVASLIAALPLIGCTAMCGVMAYMMKGKKKVKK